MYNAVKRQSLVQEYMKKEAHGNIGTCTYETRLG